MDRIVWVVVAALVGGVAGLLWRFFRSASSGTLEPEARRLTPEEGQARLSLLITSGRHIDAIKLYRELYGTGLKEAKDAVDAMRDGRAPIGPPATGNVPAPDADAAIAQAVEEGNLIQAIKLYRERHGVGLKEAKDAVEALRERLERGG
ncbi:hypothetical protein [Corallococcus carmarthensis]|uniref:hypothetical protein n=1 Tax=Corallococcus carmarthensis TaxID=2316728 RepID=UPI001ABFD5F0|nr:hypothetical protein [Corallococcus carmarthensis]